MRSLNQTTTTVGLVLFLTIAFFPTLFNYIFCTLPLAIITGNLSRLTVSSSANRPSSYTSHPSAKMSWFQKQFTLPAKSRGSYLITDTVVKEIPEIKNYKVGLLNLFVQHTSCALSLNENWDEDVREDMSNALDRIAPAAGPKGESLYLHSAEGPDDMPAHIKSALVGASVTIPISNGKLATGTWQGIWYLEFRASKHQRKIVATIQGEKM
ncbi:hypothetical protein MCOR25_007149 [Pyricularia grisea]|uniref:Uncharacterized protein n=4 Tax=Pyricularia TaxID=48558 RepID=A0A6P8BEC2_PYRGI|nr:uncharacterized protein PgNI_03819 [Pyricularia grisea]KAI6359178.1 hypothetical protein MCOR25_007149 [Pyricularia grisea]TLD14099.1 hypothetical protein PgNI_03819 [Pyricularia grisea]